MSEGLKKEESQVSILPLDEHIKQELKKFPVVDAAIEAMRKEYMGLSVSSIEDKDGHKKVRESRLVVKGKRCEVEKTRKELNEDAVKFQKAVNGEAKRIAGLLEPIESHLEAEEGKYDSWVEEEKRKKEQAEQERLQKRVAQLYSYYMTFDGNLYKRGNICIPALLLKTMDDQTFNAELQKVEEDYTAEQIRLAEEERLRKEEEERLAAQKAEEERLERERKAEEDRKRKEEEERLAVERAEIERIKKEQADKEAALKAEQEKIDAEKRAIDEKKRKDEEDKKHQEDIKKAKEEAAEQARKDEQARIEREQREKEERDRLAAIEAEELRAQMSDKDKLREVYLKIESITIPAMKSKKANATGTQVKHLLTEALEVIREGM